MEFCPNATLEQLSALARGSLIVIPNESSATFGIAGAHGALSLETFSWVGNDEAPVIDLGTDYTIEWEAARAVRIMDPRDLKAGALCLVTSFRWEGQEARVDTHRRIFMQTTGARVRFFDFARGETVDQALDQLEGVSCPVWRIARDGRRIWPPGEGPSLARIT